MASDNHKPYPGSPSRPTFKTLPGIPEVVPTPAPKPTPGPNAFAQQAERVEKHKLQGNAFYQQEMTRRKATPPTMLHPALRPGAESHPKSPPQPEMMQVRDSGVTTMSTFIGAGEEDSPPLKLLPEDNGAFPTRRGYMEEQRERLDHHAGEEVHMPVYKYTPKIPESSQFSQSVSSVTATPKKKGRVSDTGMVIGDLTSSPRKFFLEKIKIPGLRSTLTPSVVSPLSKSQFEDMSEPVPPKAQAVLGNSPPKSKIPRSPSKRMAFFSRKAPGQPQADDRKEAYPVKTPSSAPLVTGKTPQTASTANFSDCHTARTAQSDPVHNRPDQKQKQQQSRRIVSHSQSERGADKSHNSHCMVSRSQSLQYFNREIPPTPPAKNTPPHEKERKEQERQARRSSTLQDLRRESHLQDDTPTKETVRLINDGRTSPTRYGGYAHVENPKLITKPSVYSMHAAVFPDLEHASSYDEMKSRVDGLGLEGLSDLPESFYRRSPEVTYSPSIYSNDWGSSPQARFLSTPNLTEKLARPKPFTVQATIERHRAADSTHTTNTKSSSNGTIPMVYPDLASDPALSTPAEWREHFGAETDNPRPMGLQPGHGRARSQDVGNSPRVSMYSYFSRSTEDVSNPAPFSPMAKHPSAAPSPLQYLQPTMYTPTSHKSNSVLPRDERDVSPEGSPLARMGNIKIKEREDNDNSPSKSARKRQGHPFDNAPSFPARVDSSMAARSTSPHAMRTTDDVTNTDPQKVTPTSPTFPEGSSASQDSKMDAIMTMLSGLASQNEHIVRMRDEIQAIYTRLGQVTASPSASPAASSPSQELQQQHNSPASGLPLSTGWTPNGRLIANGAYHRRNQERVDIVPDEYSPAIADADRYADRVERFGEEDGFGHFSGSGVGTDMMEHDRCVRSARPGRRRSEVRRSAGYDQRDGLDQAAGQMSRREMMQLVDIVGGLAKKVDAWDVAMLKGKADDEQ